MLYRAVIFTFAPTALELAFVCFVLGKAFSPLVGGLVLATFALYTTWSIIMTQVGESSVCVQGDLCQDTGGSQRERERVCSGCLLQRPLQES
jgi:hypothetical protein